MKKRDYHHETLRKAVNYPGGENWGNFPPNKRGTAWNATSTKLDDLFRFLLFI